MKIPVVSVAAALMAMPAVPIAQQPPAFEFSIRNIMRGPEVYGRQPQRVRWTADGRWIYFNWNPPGTPWLEPPRPYRVRAIAGSQPERVGNAHLDSIAPLLETGALSADRRWRAVEAQGDIYLIDVARGTARRLTQTIAAETSPSFSANGREVYFVRDNNVFAIALDGGLTRQLTNVRAGPEPKDSAKAEGQRGVLEAQQRELLGAIRDRLYLDSLRKAEEKARDSLRVKPMYLGKDERVTSLSVAPDGRSLLIVLTTPNERATTARVPNYVTESGYTAEINTRTKVGDFQASGRIAWMSLPSGDLRFLKLAPDTTRALANTSVLGWDEPGSHALVMAGSADFKNRWMSSVSSSGDIKLLDTVYDSAWVAGPCNGCGGWYEGGRRVWFVSEADGYAHLYTMAADGSDRRQLTRGQWEVLGASLSRDGTRSTSRPTKAHHSSSISSACRRLAARASG